MKTVIVTGASRGIGAAICRNLRTKGVRVIGVARSGEALQQLCLEKIGTGPMEFVAGDVTDPTIAKTAVELATKNGTLLDALILNAGILGPVGKLATVDTKEFERGFDVNILSSINWIQAALPSLRETKGRIIFTSSGVANIPYAGFANYCASKAAMNAILGVLAQEEPDIITLAVSPGVVQTEMSTNFVTQGRPFMTTAQATAMEQMLQSSNIIKPESVAETFAKLALAAPKEKSGRSILWSEKWISNISLPY